MAHRRATTAPRILIAEDIDAYLEQHQHKSLLRFITCGSVDDGKSTLIGRLLYDSQMIFEDQLAGAGEPTRQASAPRARRSTSRCWSTASPPSASRASPSTSPTASSPPKRASSSSPTRPGHEQYTRNMVTGASTATWR
jgi:bifunctional enzyme CysN/CysC